MTAPDTLTVTPLAGGGAGLNGALTLATSALALTACTSLLAQTPRVNCAGVTHTDSVGLALLVEWAKVARQRGKRLEILQPPAQLRALAATSGLSGLLAAADRNDDPQT